MYKLVELIELNIHSELSGNRGAVLHDGWSNNGEHFLGVFAVYMYQPLVGIRSPVDAKHIREQKNCEEVQINMRKCKRSI